MGPQLDLLAFFSKALQETWMLGASWPRICRVRGSGVSQVPHLVPHLVKNLPAMQETWIQSLGQEDPLEKRLATHSSILAWRSLWTAEPGGLQSMGSQRVWTERLTLSLSPGSQGTESCRVGLGFLPKWAGLVELTKTDVSFCRHLSLVPAPCRQS